MKREDPIIAMNSRIEPDGQQLFHFLELIANAEGPAAVLAAVQSYLNAWTSERIARLQEMDGGRAPFDRDRRALPVSTVGRLSLFRDRIRHQCAALKQVGMQLTPELVELDEILSVATQMAESRKAPDFKERSAAPAGAQMPVTSRSGASTIERRSAARPATGSPRILGGTPATSGAAK
jgi:hypothetical protein